jgi:hypothetical protein
MKYRKRPVVIEAFRYGIDLNPGWFHDAVTVGTVCIFAASCEIFTLEGIHTARFGDWIIQGVKGELYPCKPDIFAITYERVEE